MVQKVIYKHIEGNKRGGEKGIQHLTKGIKNKSYWLESVGQTVKVVCTTLVTN